MAAVLLGAAACDSDRLGPAGTAPDSPRAPVADAPLASMAWAGGIPFGTFEQPTTQFGSLFNGAKLTLRTDQHPLDSLARVKARNGRVVLKLAGSDVYFQNSDGTFNFTKWKARVDRYRTINIAPYITDGTIFGHYMIDEPASPGNWGGQVVPQATLEAMAKYSKSIWPNLPTLVRVDPTWLAQWTGSYVYLDGGWAQYVERKGNVLTYINSQVAAAQKKGLSLMVGLNFQKGGLNRTPLTASQVTSWGSTLLSTTYSCGFLSWEYEAAYLTTSIRTALAGLRTKAQNRVWKSCKS
jgi:hypothetical protein